MNIQAESGLVDQVDQVDHVKTVKKANMIMLTFLLPARVRAGDSMFDVFLWKTMRWRGLGIWKSSCTSFKSGKGLRVARSYCHLKTAPLDSLRQPLSWQRHHLRKRTRVIGSDNYSVFVNGNNPAFMGTILMLHWLSQIERSVPLYPTELNLYHSSPLIRVDMSSKHRVLPLVFRCF